MPTYKFLGIGVVLRRISLPLSNPVAMLCLRDNVHVLPSDRISRVFRFYNHLTNECRLDLNRVEQHCWQLSGPGNRMLLFRLSALVLFGTLIACTPQVQLQGLTVAEPILNGGTITTSDGYELPLRMWKAAQPPRAIVLALHGFNDYSNAFAEPAAWWSRAGITTYAYDQRGFGLSANPHIWPGTDAMVKDLHEAARVIGMRHPGVPLYLLGLSMGGAVVMVADARDPPVSGIAGQILVGPAVWGRATMPLPHRIALWVGVRTMPHNSVSGRGLRIIPSDNIEMLRALGRDPLVIKETRIDALYGLVNLMDEALASSPLTRTPTLVLYGARDEIIPRGPTIRMLSNLSAPHRVALYRRGYHMLLRDLQADVVWRDIAAWIDDQSVQLPSGAEIDQPERLNTEEN